VIDSFVLSNRIHVGGISEIKKSMSCHLWVSESTMQDLKFSNGFAFILIQPLILLDNCLWYLVIYPAISLTENTYEARPAIIYFGKADRENFAFGFLLVRDTPAKVNFTSGYAF